MKVNALEWFNNIKESEMSLGLSKKVSKNFEKNREDYERDFNDAISDDLMDIEDFYKELDKSIEEVIAALPTAQGLEYCKCSTFRGLNLSKQAKNDELWSNLSFYISQINSNLESTDGFNIRVSIENRFGYVNTRVWYISRKWRFFDVFFNDLVEIDPTIPKKLPNLLFKPTERALHQVKEAFKLFANHYQEIWESTINKVAEEGGTSALNSLKSGDLKKLVGDVLYNIKKREGL